MESEKTGGDSDSDSARPLALTRCKSEPARTAQKLDPEVSKKTTLGFARVCFSHDKACGPFNANRLRNTMANIQ
ncbi:hypothetical protein E2542_SST24424 [Spatholobus suberectus]|nr:hypothetical protein E2542_SST24424 [Spatholobus suberectus]